MAGLGAELTRPTPGPEGNAWAALLEEIERCRRCPLGAVRTRVVVYRGAAHPKLVFLGEAPGREEDQAGIPFVGRAGKRLDAAIAQLGLPPSAFGVLNLVKCRPPDNRLTRAPIDACRPFLDRQFALLQASIVVSLGAHALARLDPAAPGVMTAAGRPRRIGRLWLFPLLHPAATFRSRRAATRWADDLEKLRGWLLPRLETL